MKKRAEELLWELEEQLWIDPTIDLSPWIHQQPNDLTQDQYQSAIFRAACEHNQFDITWLGAQFDRFNIDLCRRIEVVRQIFSDQVETGGSPTWSTYGPLGFTTEQLELKQSSDRAYLGQLIGNRYRIDRRIAHGGLATVYAARDGSSDTTVALKIPLQAGDRNAELDDMLRSEAGFLLEVQIEGVPRYHALVEDCTGPVLVTDLVDGVTLNELLKRSSLSTADALKLVAKISRVVDQVHRRGLIHGDIKANNIMVRDDYSPVLLDFNVTRTDDQVLGVGDHHINGTLSVMSPEALMGLDAEVDLTQDVYSLGMLLTRVCLGRNLYSADGREDALVKSIFANESRLITELEQIPLAPRAIIGWALDRSPHKRFETAGDFADACDLAASDTPLLKVPPRMRVFAWRLGKRFGTLCAYQRELTNFFGAHQTLNREVVLQHWNEIRTCVAAVSTDKAQVDAILTRLDLGSDDWPESAELFSFFCSAQPPDQLGISKLRMIVERGEIWCRDTLSRIDESLKAVDLFASAAFLVSLQARFAIRSPSAAAKWGECATAISVPKELIQPFAEACASDHAKVDWNAAIMKLDIDVVRHFRWNVHDE